LREGFIGTLLVTEIREGGVQRLLEPWYIYSTCGKCTIYL